MSDHKPSSKSNYDRWKPGTKLACMMSLKAVCQDPKFYDQTNNKFNSLTWHTVAENLNKEYPYYAKRFTNINVKDRYDRVLKHHKVFKRMANKNNGFIWNPEAFCFELNEEVFKQYERGQTNDAGNNQPDDVISKELNVARFLSKPGHIDLEYFHRYIYQFPTQEELRNDAVINCHSYIEDAISKGILNLVTSGKPNSINRPTTLGVNITSSSNNTADQYQTSPMQLQQHPPSLTDQHGNSTGTTSNSSSSIQTNTINHHSNQSMLPSSSISSQSSTNMLPVQHHPQQSPIINSSSGSTTGAQSQPNTSSELDFTGLINPTHDSHQHVMLNQNLSGLPMMAPDLTNSAGPPPGPLQHHPSSRGVFGQPPFKKPRTTSVPNVIGQPQQHNLHNLPPNIPLPSGITQTILNESLVGDGGDSLLTGTSPTHHQQHQRQSQHHQIHSHHHQLQHHRSHQQLNTIGTPTTPDGKAFINTPNSSGGLTAGEAILQLHKEFDMMRNIVNEQIINLRLSKLINHQDFENIQVVENSNDQFIRSAYKRLGDEDKLVELINIYLNKFE